MPTQISDDWIRERVLRLTTAELRGQPMVVDDTTNYMSIERDQVVALGDDLFLVRSNEHEGRFSIDEQPKFWVKRAMDLKTGRMHILKFVIAEEFKARVGPIEVRCTRSPEKEAQVLDLVRGDIRFMQGRSARDARGNLVRIIDFIPSTDLLSYLHSLPGNHEQYFHLHLPRILTRIADSLGAIQRLHDEGLCHGDIRNDHVLIERGTGQYRWIDFDLKQDFRDFDVWSAGNILHCVVGKGFVTFRDAALQYPQWAAALAGDDA